MGTFREPIRLANPRRPKATIELEAIVDTGATYTWVPDELLKRLGVKAQEVRPLKIASGKVIKRKLG
jgi:predicted aspartyl protease